jgi:hypothetical protein
MGAEMESIKKIGPHTSRDFFLSENALLCYFAFASLFLHLGTNISGGYGYFRDELYYIACSDHMAWGYVDQPPFSIAALWFSRILFGDSVFALRLLPAITGSVVVAFAGLMTRELGGNRYAQVLASLCTLLAPLTLGMNSYYSMNSFDILFWTLAFYLIIILMKKDGQKYWIILGFVLGIGLLNKISVLWLGTGLACGLLATPHRALLLTRRVWYAVVIALILFLPHIIWQARNDFPTIEFIKNATSNKYVAISPVGMFLQQVMNMNPSSILIWISGFVYFLMAKSTKQFRILPIIYVTVFLILVVNKNSKSEYLGPMFPMLFALGAFTIEKFILYWNWRWLKPLAIIIMVPGGIISIPFALPILPIETFISYSQDLGMAPSTTEKKQLSRLPQHYADMFGWDKLTAAVAEAYNTLTPEEKNKCALIGNNYGEAGALDFFGRLYHLPKAISGHNNYWLWGPHHATGEVVIRLGGSRNSLKESYREVIQVGEFKDNYCMPYENNMPIWICKNRLSSLTDDWPQFKNYN